MAACGSPSPTDYTISPANVITVTPTPRPYDSSMELLFILPTPTTPEPTITLIPVPQNISAAANPRGVEQWRELVSSIFPADAVDSVLTIMLCESGGNPNATGSAGERGLMQIHPIHSDSTYDPYLNLMAAFRISGGGYQWGPWSCKPGVG